MKQKKEKKNNFKDKIKGLINDRKILIFLICIFLFIVLSVLIFTGCTTKFDDIVTSFAIGIRNDSFVRKMKAITNLGGGYALVAISLLLFAIIKKKKIPLIIMCNLITVFLSSQILKLIFRRERPDEVFLTTANGFGYPSGHSMVSMAYVLVILYILYKTLKNKTYKVIATIVLLSLVITIGFSRVYLGVHYITDVIGGFLLGISFAMLFIKFISDKELI